MSSPGATRLRIPVTPPQSVTEVSAVAWEPEVDRGGPVVVLGHGAGTDLTNGLLRALSRGLASRGHPTVAFNFAFAEAGRKRPDPQPRLVACFRDVVTALAERYGGERALVLGGRSMGGRIASHLVAERPESLRCAGLVFLGYPLHPAGRPERLRTEHWPDLQVPILFLAGDRDRLCDLALLDQERSARLAHVSDRLHVVAGADHGFAIRKRDGRSLAEVYRELVDVTDEWLTALPAIAPTSS